VCHAPVQQKVLGILVTTSVMIGNHRSNNGVEEEGIYFKKSIYDEIIAYFIPPWKKRVLIPLLPVCYLQALSPSGMPITSLVFLLDADHKFYLPSWMLITSSISLLDADLVQVLSPSWMLITSLIPLLNDECSISLELSFPSLR
jgi:hypothetical protein